MYIMHYVNVGWRESYECYVLQLIDLLDSSHTRVVPFVCRHSESELSVATSAATTTDSVSSRASPSSTPVAGADALDLSLFQPINEQQQQQQLYATPSSVGRFHCGQCSYVGKDSWHLKRHTQDVHNK